MLNRVAAALAACLLVFMAGYGNVAAASLERRLTGPGIRPIGVISSACRG